MLVNIIRNKPDMTKILFILRQASYIGPTPVHPCDFVLRAHSLTHSLTLWAEFLARFFNVFTPVARAALAGAGGREGGREAWAEDVWAAAAALCRETRLQSKSRSFGRRN